MNVALHRRWTQHEFFAWAEAQDGRYELVGFEPVAMTGGSANHGSITINILASLRPLMDPKQKFANGPGEQLSGRQ